MSCHNKACRKYFPHLSYRTFQALAAALRSARNLLCPRLSSPSSPSLSSQERCSSIPLLLFLLLSLLSFSSLSLTCWPHTGSIGVSLLTCCVLWLCEIRRCVVETLAKPISLSNPTTLKGMLGSCKVIVFCDSTAFQAKLCFQSSLLVIDMTLSTAQRTGELTFPLSHRAGPESWALPGAAVPLPVSPRQTWHLYLAAGWQGRLPDLPALLWRCTFQHPHLWGRNV